MASATFYLILATFFISPLLGAKILGIASTPSYSHQIVLQPIWRALSQRGHQLTVLTTHPLRDITLTNLTEIDLSPSYDTWNNFNTLEVSPKDFRKTLDRGLEIANILSNHQLGLPEVRLLLASKDQHFDLLIVETLFPVMYAFSERFNCPFIEIFTQEAFPRNYDAVGNPTHPILNPSFLISSNKEMTLWQRLKNVIISQFFKYYSQIVGFPRHDKIVRRHFRNDLPTLESIGKKVSMLFTNTGLAFHQIRPLLPSIVQIGGGIHLKPPRSLPKVLETHLNNALEGFIYFSLGNNVRSAVLPNGIYRTFLETFKILPHTILWKFEKNHTSGLSDNVIMSSWFPQQDILRHPNIKLFITQGGVQSIEEALHHGVPILGIPCYSDQFSNIDMIVSKKVGLSLTYTELNEKGFRNAILEIINNPMYSRNAMKMASIIRDQPIKSLNRTIWWIEYVLRHRGVKYLESAAARMPFYQYFLLDVLGLLLVITILVVYTFMKVTMWYLQIKLVP